MAIRVEKVKTISIKEMEDTENMDNMKNEDRESAMEQNDTAERGITAEGEIEGADNAENAEDICACCHHKNTPRDAGEQKQLQNRINRMIGQLNGIKNMIDDNRYCGDILIQIGAVKSALQSLGYNILEEHMRTCVVEEIEKGNKEIMSEAVELIKRMK